MKNKKKTKKETKSYFNQANFQEKPNSSNKKFFLRNLLFFYIILILFIKAVFPFCICKSEIILKTKEIGKIKILSDNFFNIYKPCEVIINGFPQNINNSFLK